MLPRLLLLNFNNIRQGLNSSSKLRTNRWLSSNSKLLRCNNRELRNSRWKELSLRDLDKRSRRWPSKRLPLKLRLPHFNSSLLLPRTKRQNCKQTKLQHLPPIHKWACSHQWEELHKDTQDSSQWVECQDNSQVIQGNSQWVECQGIQGSSQWDNQVMDSHQWDSQAMDSNLKCNSQATDNNQGMVNSQWVSQGMASNLICNSQATDNNQAMASSQWVNLVTDSHQWVNQDMANHSQATANLKEVSQDSKCQANKWAKATTQLCMADKAIHQTPTPSQ